MLMGIVLCAAALASVGVLILVMMVWVMGWSFLWYKAPELTERQIEPEQRLVAVPGGVLLKLKLVTVCEHRVYRVDQTILKQNMVWV